MCGGMSTHPAARVSCGGVWDTVSGEEEGDEEEEEEEAKLTVWSAWFRCSLVCVFRSVFSVGASATDLLRHFHLHTHASATPWDGGFACPARSAACPTVCCALPRLVHLPTEMVCLFRA